MKPGDFVSTPYYHYTAYGYIESISDYGTTKVLMAYRYNKNTKRTNWDKSGGHNIGHDRRLHTGTKYTV
jgi:hypothetical protein